MIFKIGNADSGDYSNRVLAGTYNVHSKPIYTSWTDTNGVEHRDVTRASKTAGTFDMFFRSITEYDTFVSLISSLRTTSLAVPCTVMSNTTNTTVTGNFFIDFEPVRNRRGDWADFMEKFTVKITEA